MQHLIHKIDAEFLVKALKSCFSKDFQKVALHEPTFSGKEWDSVKECLDTGWVSSAGKFVDQFELKLAEFTGVKRAVAVVNGTSALHASLKLAGVEAGDEVLVPTLTFVATANAVTYCGATPHFVDSEEKTLGVDPEKLRIWLTEIGEIRNGGFYNRKTGRRIKALIVVHVFGHPVDLDPISEFCSEMNITLIEDAAGALGSYYKGRHVGNRGKFSIVSFNGNKIITTGGGGAILTNDEEAGELAKHVTSTAKLPHPWLFEHDQVGFNYRMPNLNAALGCSQIEQLPRLVERQRNLAARYQKALSTVEGLAFFNEPEFAKSNFWLNALLLNEDQASRRDVLLSRLHDNGLGARPSWTLMHKLPMFRNNPRMDLTTAQNLESRLINIPSSAFLS